MLISTSNTYPTLRTAGGLKPITTNLGQREFILENSDWFALTGAHEEIDYSAKLKFSDDEGDEEGEEEKTESSNDSRYVTEISHIIISDSSGTYFVIPVCILFKPVYFSLVPSEQQRSKDTPPTTSSSRASDSGTESRHAPSSTADNGPKPPSSKPGRAEEGGSGWGGQGAPSNYQVEMLS